MKSHAHVNVSSKRPQYQVTSILVEDTKRFCIITSALTPEYLKTVAMGQCGPRSETKLQLTPSPVPQTSIAQTTAVFAEICCQPRNILKPIRNKIHSEMTLLFKRDYWSPSRTKKDMLDDVDDVTLTSNRDP